MTRRRPRRKKSAGAANMARTATSTRKAPSGSKARPPAPSKALSKASPRAASKAKASAKGNGALRGSAKHAAKAVKAPERRASEKIWQSGRVFADAGLASRGKYVYCIIESNDALRFGPIGIGADPSDVYTVHYKNLAAVVSDAPLEVLDSTRENVLAHERVNETVMREHTVIPMSFGTIFKTREDIVELLRSAAEAFGDVLNKMQNKLEFGLKVLWDRDQAIREVENEDEDISRLKKEISGQKGPTYFARMQYGRLIDSALQARSERYVADILDH